MIAFLTEIELQQLDSLDREQLLAKLSHHLDCLPLEFTHEWQDRQATDSLRMLLLAARVIHLLRLRDRRRQTAL
jgi:hypothetical protein